MQENNIKFLPIIELGFYLFEVEDLDLNYWTELCYDTKKNDINSVNRSNRGGWQSDSNLCHVDQFKPLTKLIQDLCYPIFNEPQLTVRDLWINISSFTNYNTPHTHMVDNDSYPYKNYSGVIYLKVPSNSGQICFKNPLNSNGWVEIPPKEKGILIFPSVIEHYVAPNLSKEDRISLAFNFNTFIFD